MLLPIFQVRAWEEMSVGKAGQARNTQFLLPPVEGARQALCFHSVRRHTFLCVQVRVWETAPGTSYIPPTTVLGTGEQNDGAQDPTPWDAGCVLALPVAGVRKLHFPRGRE